MNLGFGLMRLPIIDDDITQIDQNQVNSMIDYALKNGVSFFDTAWTYHGGFSQNVIRKGLVERYNRNDFQISNKMPVSILKNSSEYLKIFEQQLEICGVSFFDYYLLHNLRDKNYETAINCNGFEFLQKIKNEGKALNVGFSFHGKATLLDKILTENPNVDFVLLQLNYLDWNGEKEAEKNYLTAIKHNKKIMVMEPLKGGLLANVPSEVQEIFYLKQPGVSAANWAFRFLANLENVIMVLSGMSSIEQMQDNIKTMQDIRPLDNNELAIIWDAVRIINSTQIVPCTNCSYCLESCPANIKINKLMNLLNDIKRYGDVPSISTRYRYYTQNGTGADSCRNCLNCIRSCPQGINIPEELNKFSKIFDLDKLAKSKYKPN